MLNRNGSLNLIERKIASNAHRDIRTSDGHNASMWAYPRGIPPRARHSVSLTPYYFSVFRDIGAFLRYRFKHHGAWVVEIREHSFERVVADGVFPSRAAGMAGLERARELLPTLRLTNVDHQTLGAPARVT